MRIATLFAGAILALGMATASTSAVAAPVIPKSSVAVDSKANVVDVRRHGGHHYGHRHYRHRNWRGPRVIIGGGGYGYGYGYNRCRQVRRSCGYNFGWGTRAFYRCTYRRGC
jgi:hypothetical protein